EQPPLYMNETPAEYLRFVGEAKGLRGAELERQIQAVIEQVRIAEVKNRRISALSKGYKQRVGIAQALLELTLKRASLEDIFLELTADDTALPPDGAAASPDREEDAS
ncbi:MAG: ATP-binding cassette domain-containing protein, partial [Evtepia sp.]|nr:ATP-binding cassette domain-containing protein [Evtepia sp.]